MSYWNLTPDGDPIATRAARLLPVLWDGQKAMLKLAVEEEERAGGVLLVWWDGVGAARVLANEGGALLMERAAGLGCLSDMARTGRDDEACDILCATAARLHAPRAKPFPELIPLTHWFRTLSPVAAARGGLLRRCDMASRKLLATPQEVIPLHGDLHHGNVLDFGSRGWLTVDPKCLMGERGFDFANIFCNPDLLVAAEPYRFLRRLTVVAEAARLERRLLLLWILAWCGLSAAFSLEDGDAPPLDLLRVAELAAAGLDR
ncbi:aminoglycoside phosphotransferase family protein [Lichenicoccus sp.]|uniref:aminoglycoside phosphotransferase family protein n=1 Tax=Lichenicoccus sp. TaxID=2781899 RepID=UPI003D0B67E2